MLLVSLSFILLTACGGGNSSGNTTSPSGGGGTHSQTGLPNDLNGLLVFDTSRSAYGSTGIFSFDISDGSIIPESIGKITEGDQGEAPYAYDRNTIVYAKRCNGTKTHHVKTIKGSGLASSFNITTPCTSAIKARTSTEGYQNNFAPIKVAKLSPDQTKVAISVEHYIVYEQQEAYTVFIYDVNTGEEVSRYPKYASPEWLSDGRLLLTPDGDDAVEKKGIYITDHQLSSVDELTRIDKEEIPTHVDSIDLSPSGKQLTFSMAGNIWIMDINGDNLEKVIVEKHDLHFPTWSPDGRYIAYLSYSGIYLQKITFFNIATKKPFIFELKLLTPADSNNDSYIDLEGPLSWVK
jgi:Tol biopolymer transport system component